MTQIFVFLMGRLPTVSKRAKWAGIVLIVLIGLLNFHVPQFLLELALFANVRRRRGRGFRHLP